MFGGSGLYIKGKQNTKPAVARKSRRTWGKLMFSWRESSRQPIELQSAWFERKAELFPDVTVESVTWNWSKRRGGIPVLSRLLYLCLWKQLVHFRGIWLLSGTSTERCFKQIIHQETAFKSTAHALATKPFVSSDHSGLGPVEKTLRRSL